MNHPRFEFLGAHYPRALEERFDRILTRIDELWDTPAIDDYFDDLIIDRRGGRQGFPKEVLEDIMMLREARAAERMRIQQERENALTALRERGLTAGPRDFIAAVRSGDKSLVDLFVQAGANVRATDGDGTPALIVAMKLGFSIIANMLITAGADAMATDKWGVAPLLLACGKNTQGFRAIAEALVRRGAQVNARDPLGNTPLLLALSGGTADVAELLIQHGAEVNVRARDGKTPLMLAHAAGNERLVALLVEKGAQG